MNNSPVEFFDNLLNLEIDTNLYTFLKMFRISWAQKTYEHIDYLSNPYIGVYEIKFSTKDDSEFLEHFGLEKDELQKEVYKIKGINRAFKVSSNCMFILMVYLMHKFKSASRLSTEISEDAMRELYYIIHYKMISSIDNHFFKYKMDISIAKTIRERSNNKYYLKQFSSWNEILNFKFKTDVINGVYKQRLDELDTDNYVLIINDMKTKITSIFKNYFMLYKSILDNNEVGIKSSTLLKEGEDEEEIKDITNRRTKYMQNILTIYQSNVDLIIPELITIIQGVVVGTKDQDIYSTLQYLSGKNDIPKLKEHIETMVQLSFEALDKKPVSGNLKEALYDVAYSIKSFYISNDGIKKYAIVKKDLEKIVKKLIKSSNFYRIRNIVLFVCIYYPCRSFLTKQGT